MHCYDKSPTLHETRKNRQEEVSDVMRTATEALKDLKWNATTHHRLEIKEGWIRLLLKHKFFVPQK